jgi:cobyrinic acid a,c-diamide synthase
LTAADGTVHAMVGALPGRSIMTPRLTMGYRQVVAGGNTFLAPAGLAMRGHEFHYSDWVERPADMPAAYEVSSRRGEQAHPEGYARDQLVASYIHLHFGAAPLLAERMVAACRGGKQREMPHAS